MTYPVSPVHDSNYGVPRQETRFIVLHGTGLSSTATAEDELAYFSKELPAAHRSSYSYYIAKDGRVWSLVPPDRVAFHAGTSSWSKAAAERRGVTWPAEEGDAHYAALNLSSIGIGLESHNAADETYPEAQLDACAALCRDLMQRYDIPLYRVLTHYMVSAPRKVDPVGFKLEEFYMRIQKLAAPLLVVDAPEPVVHEGDYGSDLLLRIRGKNVKVDARFDTPGEKLVSAGEFFKATPPPAVKTEVGGAYRPPNPPSSTKLDFSGVHISKPVKVVPAEPKGDVPMPIPAREAIALKSKAAQASEADPNYRLKDEEAVRKYVTMIGNIIGALLSIATSAGLITLTELQAEELVIAVTGALGVIWPTVISICAELARRRVYSEKTVGQMLADYQEVVKSDSSR